MGYLGSWRILEEMITDLRRNGIEVPRDVVSSLRDTKTLINILKADPANVGTRRKIEESFRSLESYFSSEGEKKLGAKYVQRWISQLDEAASSVDNEEEAKLVPDLPRHKKWIRVKPSPDLSVKVLEALAKKSKVSYETQEDGYLIFYGEEDQVKNFVRKVAAKCGSRGGEI